MTTTSGPRPAPAASSLPAVVSLAEKLAQFGDVWSPRVVGEVNERQGRDD